MISFVLSEAVFKRQMLDLEQQIFKQIEKSNSILIILPADGDGDALASALALFIFLKKAAYTVELVSSQGDGLPKNLNFLPSYPEIKNNLDNLRRFIVSLDIRQAKISQIKYTVDSNQLNFIISPSEGWFKPEDVSSKAGEFKYDLIITIGAADLESFGKFYDQNVEFFYKTTIINLDHRSTNEEFGQINFVDLNAVATSEILFYILKNYKPELITEDIATCLLAGIIFETKNFKTANLTPRTLLTTSQLISLGARREEIVNHLYRSRDLAVLKLWGRILNNLKDEADGQLIWSKIKINDLTETKTTYDNLTDIVDELIANIPSAKVIVILGEEEIAKTRLIIYSLKNLNALDLLKKYHPHGTVKLAQATINKDLETISSEIIPELKSQLDKLTS